MKFDCDRCGTRYNIADEKVRRKVLKIRCRVCENIITVRGADLVDQAPPPGDAEWYAAPGGEELGPMPLIRLEGLVEQGEVAAETLVWREGFDDWRPVAEVEALAKLLPTRSVLDDEATNTFQMHDRIDDSLREMLLGTPPPAEAPPPMFGDTIATEGIGWPEDDDDRPTIAEPVRRPTGPTRPVEPRTPRTSRPPPSRPPLGRALDPATQPPVEEPRRFPVVPVAAGVMLLLLLAVGIGYWVARPAPPPMVPAPQTAPPAPADTPAPPPEAPPATPTPSPPAAAPPPGAAAAPTDAPRAAPVPAPTPQAAPEAAPEPDAGPEPDAAPPVEETPPTAAPEQPKRRPRPARSDPKVRLDVQPADADPPETLSKSQVTLVIGANWDGVTACYDRQVEAGAAPPGGKVVLRFDIRPTGRTSNARIDRVPAGFADCVRAVVQSWRFPQFTGDPIPVEYPLILKPPK